MSARFTSDLPPTPVAIYGVILEPATEFTAREMEAYRAARIRDLLILADINEAAGRLHALYEGRKLGYGRDPAWKAAVDECQNLLDDLYARRRQVLARMSAILASVLRRRRRRSQNPAVRIFEGRNGECAS